MPSGLSDAVFLMMEQEDQGVAADVTQDLFLTAALQDSKLPEAVLAYFVAGKDASPNTETYTSLIYACVKFRQLDEGFQHFEAMMAAGILPDCRTYAHLIKGCGRTKQLRRGASFFELLKQRNAPEVFTLRVYNAMINMYAHKKNRGAYLAPAEAAPSWEVFSEMFERAIAPDHVTYNSLISLCSRTKRPDVTRALAALDEMEAVGIPIGAVTLSCLSQVLGRANMIAAARERITATLLKHDDIEPASSIWRPLLHAAAVGGDFELTQSLYDEMVHHTGSTVFDSFKHRVSQANNYLILADGYANGYEAARTRFEEARKQGIVDLLSYSFLFELAISHHAAGRGPHRSTALTPEGRQVALNLWSEMEADGVRPNAPICHKMFGIWMQEGMADKAEEVFSEMKSNSAKLQATGRDLAEKWLGGDLDAVKLVLENTPLALQTMCHTSSTYVKLIDACIAARDSTRAMQYLSGLQLEAEEKGISLGHDSTTPIVRSFGRGTGEDLATALQFHAQAFEKGRPIAVQPSLELSRTLVKDSRWEDAARVLLQMARPYSGQSWVFGAVEQRLSKMRDAANSMEPHSDGRQRLEGLLTEIAERLDLPSSKASEGASDSAKENGSAAIES